MKHLSYCLQGAEEELKENNKHAQLIMKELGIKYFHSTPQSMNATWWFWCCTNIPEKLPKFLEVIDLDPIECIGYGLSKAKSNEIISHLNNHAKKDIEPKKSRFIPFSLICILAMWFIVCFTYAKKNTTPPIEQSVVIDEVKQFEIVKLNGNRIETCNHARKVEFAFAVSRHETNYGIWLDTVYKYCKPLIPQRYLYK